MIQKKLLFYALVLLSSAHVTTAMEEVLNKADEQENTVQEELATATNLLFNLIKNSQDIPGPIRALIKTGVDVNARNDDSYTPLHLAAARNLIKVCIVLILQNSDIDATEKNGNTALHVAAARGHLVVCLLLLEKGAHVNSADNLKNTPLHYAASFGHSAIADLLMERGAYVKACNKDCFTPLHAAARNGHVSLCFSLIQNGANVNAKDNWYRTPLFWASENGHVNCCAVLLENSANPNALDGDSSPPITGAAKNGHLKACALLISKGADIKSTWRYRNKALHLAASNDHMEVCILLLENGADVDGFDLLDQTPLHVAAFHGRTAICNLLLTHGARIDALNKSSLPRPTPPFFWTALHYAAFAGQTDVCILLLRRDAPVDYYDFNGYTPLCLGAKQGHASTCKEILSNIFLNRVLEIHKVSLLDRVKELPYSLLSYVWPSYENNANNRIVMILWCLKQLQLPRDLRYKILSDRDFADDLFRAFLPTLATALKNGTLPNKFRKIPVPLRVLIINKILHYSWQQISQFARYSIRFASTPETQQVLESATLAQRLRSPIIANILTQCGSKNRNKFE